MSGDEKIADRNMANLIIAMRKEERKTLKQMDLNKDVTVSALLHGWLKEYQEEETEV